MLLKHSEFESNLSVILVRFSFCVLEDEQKELLFFRKSVYRATALLLCHTNNVYLRNIYIYIYTHTHTHTYIYIYIHTHIHTYIYIYRVSQEEGTKLRESVP